MGIRGDIPDDAGDREIVLIIELEKLSDGVFQAEVFFGGALGQDDGIGARQGRLGVAA